MNSRIYESVLPKFPDNEPVVVAAAVWSRVVISGSGIMLNRAAFELTQFIEFWLYMRIPCGKWGSMMLWEGILHSILIQKAGMMCYTFSNDIKSLNLAPNQWGDSGLIFYKHKNSGNDVDILNFVTSHNPVNVPFQISGSVEKCDV